MVVNADRGQKQAACAEKLFKFCSHKIYNEIIISLHIEKKNNLQVTINVKTLMIIR